MTIAQALGGVFPAMIILAVVATMFVTTVATMFVTTEYRRGLMRVTPAAAFAVQQTVVQYPQVADVYGPAYGYYPLAPWAGFAVLCGWTALALALACILLNRRDA